MASKNPTKQPFDKLRGRDGMSPIPEGKTPRQTDRRLGIGLALVVWIPTLLWLVPHYYAVAADGILAPYRAILGGVIAVFSFLAWFFPDLFVSLLFGLNVKKDYQGLLFWFGLLPCVATIILATRAGLILYQARQGP